MSGNIDIEANNNSAEGGAQAVGNSNTSTSSSICCTTRTAIVTMVGVTIISAISLGVGFGLESRSQDKSM